MVITTIATVRGKTKTMWSGEQAAKGYLEEDLVEAIRRYVPKSAAKSMFDELFTASRKPAEEDSTDAEG